MAKKAELKFADTKPYKPRIVRIRALLVFPKMERFAGSNVYSNCRLQQPEKFLDVDRDPATETHEYVYYTLKCVDIWPSESTFIEDKFYSCLLLSYFLLWYNSCIGMEP